MERWNEKGTERWMEWLMEVLKDGAMGISKDEERVGGIEGWINGEMDRVGKMEGLRE